jgi:PTS system mannitol-specific IIC component
VLVSTMVTFSIAAIIIRWSSEKNNDAQLSEAKEIMKELKGQGSRSVKKVVFACDAGMGSSAMGATALRNKFKKVGLTIDVVNCAIEDIPQDAQIVVTHEKLANRAKHIAPQAEFLLVKDFIENTVFETLMLGFQPVAVPDSLQAVDKAEDGILRKRYIKLGLSSMDRDDAIKMAGQLLIDGGYVNAKYVEGMLERERDLSTYIGKGIAIPHGVGRVKEHINKSGMVVLQFPQGVTFGEEKANLVIGIAGVGNEHLSILANIATAIDGEDDTITEALKTTTDVEYIYKLFMVEA